MAGYTDTNIIKNDTGAQSPMSLHCNNTAFPGGRLSTHGWFQILCRQKTLGAIPHQCKARRAVDSNYNRKTTSLFSRQPLSLIGLLSIKKSITSESIMLVSYAATKTACGCLSRLRPGFDMTTQIYYIILN